MDAECATLLGSPLGSIEAISEAVNEKINLLKVMGNSLQYLHAHDAILLLRHSFAIPKLLYVIQTAPFFISPSLKEYDAVLRSMCAPSLIIISKRKTHHGFKPLCQLSLAD